MVAMYTIAGRQVGSHIVSNSMDLNPYIPQSLSTLTSYRSLRANADFRDTLALNGYSRHHVCRNRILHVWQASRKGAGPTDQCGE